MNTFERAQEITNIGPQSFGGVAVNFANAIAIIIARPFTRAMGNGRVRADDMVIALIFVSEDVRPDECELMDMLPAFSPEYSSPPAIEPAHFLGQLSPQSAVGQWHKCRAHVVCWPGGAGDHLGRSAHPLFSPAF